MKYTIVFVDEELADQERFKRYIHRKDEEKLFKVITLIPTVDIEELTDKIISLNPDALVSDFSLNEFKGDVTYNGVEVVNAILLKKKDFPCFVLTSYDDSAAKQSTDVNRVYIKELMNLRTGESDAKISFYGRIILQIQKYRERVGKAHAAINELSELKSSRPLTSSEEEMYVDSLLLLDKHIDNEGALPRAFYTNDTNELLQSIIKATNDLIVKMNDNTKNT